MRTSGSGASSRLSRIGRDAKRREGEAADHYPGPSREVAPNYFACAVDTKEGDSYTGIIVHETASSVTVRQPLGNEVLVPRSRIAKIQAQSTSLIKSSTALEAEVFRHDSRSLDWPAIDSQRIPERYSLP